MKAEHLQKGQMVWYYDGYRRPEQGRVKSIQDDVYAFVVFSCNGEWEEYEKYTAARTHIGSLSLGKPEERQGSKDAYDELAESIDSRVVENAMDKIKQPECYVHRTHVGTFVSDGIVVDFFFEADKRRQGC